MGGHDSVGWQVAMEIAKANRDNEWISSLNCYRTSYDKRISPELQTEFSTLKHELRSSGLDANVPVERLSLDELIASDPSLVIITLDANREHNKNLRDKHSNVITDDNMRLGLLKSNLAALIKTAQRWAEKAPHTENHNTRNWLAVTNPTDLIAQAWADNCAVSNSRIWGFNLVDQRRIYARLAGSLRAIESGGRLDVSPVYVAGSHDKQFVPLLSQARINGGERFYQNRMLREEVGRIKEEARQAGEDFINKYRSYTSSCAPLIVENAMAVLGLLRRDTPHIDEHTGSVYMEPDELMRAVGERDDFRALNGQGVFMGWPMKFWSSKKGGRVVYPRRFEHRLIEEEANEVAGCYLRLQELNRKMKRGEFGGYDGSC